MTDKFCPEYEILARSVSSSGSQLFSQFRDSIRAAPSGSRFLFSAESF